MIALLGCGSVATKSSDGAKPSATDSPKPSANAEVILDRYKGKGLLVIATPSSGDASYKKYLADRTKIDRLANDIGLTIVEIVNLKSGQVQSGPALDTVSIARLQDAHQLDATTFTMVATGGDGKEIIKKSGDVDVKGLLETL